MFRRIIGIGISRSIRPFVLTRRCTRTWINRGNKDFIQEPQTELISDKKGNSTSENKEKTTSSSLFGKNPISTLFLEAKDPEVIVPSSSSPTPTT